MNNPFLIALASAALTAVAIKAAPAAAQAVPTAETNISVVSTADLNLRSEAGQRQLDQRLAKAAREVCGTASNADLEGLNHVRKCRDETLARARAQGEGLVARAQYVGTISVTATR